MYQTFARIIGTIVVTKLIAWLKVHGYLPATFGLTPEQIEYIGYGVLAAIMAAWSARERWAKGFFTWSSRPPSNIPSLKAPVASLNTVASVTQLQPAAPESKIP